MEAFLNNWMSHIEMMETEEIFSTEKIFFNIKIIEIILELKTNPITFLEKLVSLKTLTNLKALERYEISKNFSVIKRNAAEYEVGILSFVFCYLKYNEVQ